MTGGWHLLVVRSGRNDAQENLVNTAKVCKDCGAALPASAAGDSCPQCVAGRPVECGNKAAASPSDASTLATPNPAGPLPGEKLCSFGEYELLEVIGEGGMGKAYKARQPLLNRFVAVKILSPRLASDPSYITRFRREA